MLLAADLIKLSILVSQFSIKLHNFAAMLKSIIIVVILVVIEMLFAKVNNLLIVTNDYK